MKKLSKKQKIIIFVIAFVLITPLIVFYILDKNGTFDTRSSADTSLTGDFAKADLNDDDKITIADFSIWLVEYRAFKADPGYPSGTNMTASSIGDLDEDGSVAIADFAMWLKLWRSYKGSGTDGSVCTASSECLSGVCLTYYIDADNDGYGVQDSSIKRCGTETIEGYISNSKEFDCYDSNNKAHPGVTGCFDTDRGDGSYDYNCDGKGDKCEEIVCENNDECTSGICTTFYKDGDGDGYGNVKITTKICGTESPQGYVANDDDCYDSNKDAKPGQTACFTNNRGDGSYDYNCNGSQDKCNSCYKIGPSGKNNMWCGIGGRCVETSEPATSVSSIACGSSGNEAAKITCYNRTGCVQKRPVTYYGAGAKCTMSCN